MTDLASMAMWQAGGPGLPAFVWSHPLCYGAVAQGNVAAATEAYDIVMAQETQAQEAHDA